MWPIVLMMALELGWLPEGTMLMYEPTQAQVVSNWTYAEFSARAAMGPVFAEGRMRSTQGMLGDEVGWPGVGFTTDGMLYEVGGGVEVGPLTVGFRRMCTHPVMAYLPVRGGEPIWEGWYGEVYARAKLEWRSR